MFNLRQLHLQLVVPLTKFLLKLVYEVHIFPRGVVKYSVTLAQATKRRKVVVAKPTAALLTLES